MHRQSTADVQDLPIDLERDGFLRNLIGHLCETLEDVVGLEDAAGFISVVGSQIGNQIDRQYRLALGTERLTADQVAAVLQDLKRRLQGGFRIVSADADKVVLENSCCPFGKDVNGRPALCMMTSNVFGRIAANNVGYAKVSLLETIARGDKGCRVVVYFSEAGSRDADGIEYFSQSAT